MTAGTGPIDLVTGGAGFIGGHVARRLHQSGRRVRILDRVAPAADDATDDFHPGSVTDADAVAEAMVGVQRVFHLAALADLWVADKREFFRVNHEGTRQVLLAAAAAGVETVVHCSTEAVLAGCTRPDGLTVDEDAMPALDTMPGPYPRAKLLAEHEAFAAAASGQRVVIVNPTVPIGPGDPQLTPPARMLLGFLNGDYPAYLETLLNLVDVRDVAEGHLRAAERGVPGRRYVLGGTNLQLSELLDRLHSLTGLSMPRHRIPYWVAHAAGVMGEFAADHLTGHPPAAPLTGVRLARHRVRFDSARACAELGVSFRPLEDSLRAAIADFAERGLLTRRPTAIPPARS